MVQDICVNERGLERNGMAEVTLEQILVHRYGHGGVPHTSVCLLWPLQIYVLFHSIYKRG